MFACMCALYLTTIYCIAGTFYLEGVEQIDFEDITIGNGPDPDISYIYLGDIGNNHYARNELYVYRFPEPTVAST